jgi:hypothetical protein
MAVAAVVAFAIFGVVAVALLLRFWPLLFLAGFIYLGYRMIRSAAGPRSVASVPRVSGPPSRENRVAHVKRAVPANEPIRATLIQVVEEAFALRAMADRITTYPFVVDGIGSTLHPDTFRAKSDEAIAVALDLTDRLHIVLANTRGLERSPRAAAALSAQREKMEHLREALVYSRDAIEEIILTRGERPDGTRRLSQSLRNLTDAIDESYRDPFDVALERAATIRPTPLPRPDTA